jgi:hypothetical protein
VEYIGSYTFELCSSLTSVTIPGSIEGIGNSAFALCTSLSSVVIPEGAEYIGYRAFVFCDSLSSVTIPRSVTSIDETAFQDSMENLTLFVYYGSYAETYARSKGIKYIRLEVPLTVTKGTGGGLYTEGTQVSVSADAAPSGQVFAGWTGTGASGVGDVGSAQATFTMPAEAVALTATYKYAAPAAAIDYANEKLTGLVANVSYQFNSGAGVAATGGSYPISGSWFGKDLSIVRKAGAGIGVSDAQTLAIPARPAAPSVSKVDETVVGKNDGKITGVSAAMEYKASAKAAWTAVTAAMLTGDALTGLAPGTYQLRYKATDRSFVSESVTVQIAKGEPEKKQQSMGAISATDGSVSPDAISATDGSASPDAISATDGSVSPDAITDFSDAEAGDPPG